MTPAPLDRRARKQVLLTRIALQRIQLGGELARVRQALSLTQLLGSLVPRPDSLAEGGWIGLALQILRRYRLLAVLVGGAAPLLRGQGWRRIVRLAGLAAAAYFGWRFVNNKARPGRKPR